MTELESEIFYLMEVWNIDYNAIMSLPCSLRYRLLMRKQELEKKRHEAANRK